MAGIASEARTDEQLVAAVRRGDDRSFEQLYERYQRRIAAYVYGMVGDYGRAEDITQEIFVSSLRRMRATERPIAFKPWIYEIARNACIDQFRRSRRTEEISYDAEAASGGLDSAHLNTAFTTDAVVDAKQQLDDLCGAFGGLSDSHHAILVMRELEGLSYREIGERLGLSRPSVESTLFRARRRLTEEYEELISGERCRRVTELLASGDSLGAREEKRLARHIAHCQPCRRQAYAAGVDTATLTRTRRRGVARVAALLPVPAFLRFRGSSAAQWSNTAATLAEPAAGWTKAAIAAAVLVAGGAGVAGHGDGGAPRELVPAAPVVAPKVQPARAHSASVKPIVVRQRPFADAPAGGSKPEPARRAAERSGTPSAEQQLPRVIPPSGSAQQHAAPDQQRAVTPPSAADVPEPAPADLPEVRLDPPASPPSDAVSGPSPSLNMPATPSEAASQLERSVTAVDGNAGRVVSGVTGVSGLGG